MSSEVLQLSEKRSDSGPYSLTQATSNLDLHVVPGVALVLQKVSKLLESAAPQNHGVTLLFLHRQ